MIAWSWCAGAALFAQSRSNYGLRMNGFGGFGFGSTNIQSGALFESSYRDLSSELGLDTRGFVYDPRLLNCNFSTFWNGNNTAIDQGSARANGLTFNGNLAFLPQRSFPFTLYFSRNRSDNGGSLLPLFASINTLWGLRGELKKPRRALISYNLGLGKTENNLPNGDVFNTRNRFANVTATRKLFGWNMRLGENYLKNVSTFANFLDRNNTVSFDASRAYGERIHTDLGVAYSSFAFKDLTGVSSTSSGVTLINGRLTWKHTDRLDSFYNFNMARNAVNTLRLLATANAATNLSLPFNVQSLNSASQTLVAGANYRPTTSLSLNANLSYSHNGLPEQTLTSLAGRARNVFTTDVFNTGVGYSFRHKVWRLNYNNASSVNWQRFSLANGGADSGLGYNLDNGLSGGDVRKARFSASYRFSSRSNPFFFNVVTTSDRHATLKLDSEYLRFVSLQGLADIGTTKLDLAGSHINLDTSNYMVSAAFPRSWLSVFASRGVSSSLERFFGPDSFLFQPGGSTGAVPLPAALLNPLIFSDILSQRVGLVWRPRHNLEAESRLSRNQYLFTFLNEVENRYKQFDTTAHFKFGRFTILAGYGRARSDAFRFNNRVNRFFFRIRFPFQVL